MSAGSRKSRALREGEAVRLDRESGETLHGLVLRAEGDVLDVVVRARVHPGELLHLSRAIRDDARYAVLIEVLEAGPGRSRVRLVGDWQRVQMREFVRVSVFGVPLEVERDQPGETRSERELRLERLRAERREERPARLLDLSGGGLRFESHGRFELGESIELAFSLPETGPLVVRGEVVRVHAAPEPAEASTEPPGSSQYGVRFERVDESMRVKIMTWVFREQASRFRQSKKPAGAEG